MRFTKAISLLALAALLAGSASPAFAQRDTRPEDRPQIETSEDHDERDDRPDVGRLPKGTAGTECELVWDGDQISGVLLSNDTGKTIPVGTVITVYIQPGNIQKQFKVTVDWHAGTEVDIANDFGGVSSIATCSMKVQPERAESRGLPQPEGELPWYEQGPLAFRCLAPWVISENSVMVGLFNDGAAVIPAGTKIIFQLPDGQWYTVILEEDWQRNTEILVKIHYTDALKEIKPGTWPGCPYVKVESGYNGPGVEEQGLVPKIDPSKIP